VVDVLAHEHRIAGFEHPAIVLSQGLSVVCPLELGIGFTDDVLAGQLIECQVRAAGHPIDGRIAGAPDSGSIPPLPAE